MTTQESDHADDDSLEGQIMRFFKGYKAEEEVNDFVRRTRDGKREKALGNEEKGIPHSVHHRHWRPIIGLCRVSQNDGYFITCL
ncbi:MAG TPA: hypothetical protein VFZ02_01040 [Ktedonobacteraceae bacterium]